jgi:hypothetical protein
MVGTFYWHNQFAAFMIGTGLVAGVLAVRGTGLLRRVGWLTAPWCFASLAFAGSRAGLAIFILLWLLVVGLSFVDRRGRTAALALPVVALGLASVLASPLLMEDSGWFTSTVQAREAEQSTEGNGRARLALWHAAVDLGMDHPVTGAGFDSFGPAGSARMPADSGLSRYVHNGYLQAFSDGGVVLLVAVIAATGAPLLASCRFLFHRLKHDDLVALGVPACLAGLVLHSGVDFDWVYPSLGALFAISAAVLPVGGVRRPLSWRRAAPGAMVVVLLVVAAVPASLRASGLRAPGAEPPIWASPLAEAIEIHEPVNWLPAVSTCRAELVATQASARRHGIACAESAARDDPGLQLLRAHAMVRNGDTRRGLELADQVVTEYGASRPMVRLAHAEVLRAAGRRAEATRSLLALRRDLAARGLEAALPYVDAALRTGDSAAP